MKITDFDRLDFLRKNKCGLRINPLGTAWTVYTPIIQTRPWNKVRDIATHEEYDDPAEAIDNAIKVMEDKND